MIPPPPRSTLFPYTTLFRSREPPGFFLPERNGVLHHLAPERHQLRAAAVHAEFGAHADRSEEHTSELQSPDQLVCRLLLEQKNCQLQLETYNHMATLQQLRR